MVNFKTIFNRIKIVLRNRKLKKNKNKLYKQLSEQNNLFI